MNGKQFCICNCYFYRNIFLNSLKMHTIYENDDQFLKEYGSFIAKSQRQPVAVLEEVV